MTTRARPEVKISYRGHEIHVYRDRCLGGWSMLFFSIFRESDLYECTSGFEDSAGTVRGMAASLKRQVDQELARRDPWDEKGKRL